MSTRKRRNTVGRTLFVVSDKKCRAVNDKFEKIIKGRYGSLEDKYLRLEEELDDNHNPEFRRTGVRNLKCDEKTIKRFFNGEPVNTRLFQVIADYLGEDWNELRKPDLRETVPRNSVRYFSGNSRLNQIRRISAALIRNEPIALYGRGGAGKTELVLKLIDVDLNENKRFSGGYCFIRGNSLSEIDLQIERFFQDYVSSHLVSPAPEQLERKERLQWYYKEYPYNDRPVLLVFDSVSKYEDIVPYLPVGSARNNFKVIVTTRKRNLSDVFDAIQIAELEAEEAVELLESKINIQINNKSYTDNHHEELRIISTLVGYLPLALEIVGGYIAGRLGKNNIFTTLVKKLENDSGLAPILSRTSNTGYVDRLVEGELLAELQEKGLRAVFNISWESFKKEEKKVAYVLSLFAPGAVNYPLIRKAFLRDNEESFDSILFDTLFAQSFIDQTEDYSFQYHDLIRKFVRGNEEPFIKEEIYEKRIVASLVINAYDRNHFLTSSNIQLLNHIKYVMETKKTNDAFSQIIDDLAINIFREFVSSIYQSKQDVKSQRQLLLDDTYYQTSDRFLDEAISLKNSAIVNIQERSLETALQETEQAITAIQDAIAQNGNNEEYTNLLINIHLQAIEICLQLDDPQQARLFHGSAYQVWSDGVSEPPWFSISNSDFAFYYGRILKAENKPEEAIEQFEIAISFLSKIYDGRKIDIHSDRAEHFTITTLLLIYTELVHLHFDLGSIDRVNKYIGEWEDVCGCLPDSTDNKNIAEDYFQFAIKYTKSGVAAANSEVIPKVIEYFTKSSELYSNENDEVSKNRREVIRYLLSIYEEHGYVV